GSRLRGRHQRGVLETTRNPGGPAMSIFPLARRTFLRGTGALIGLPLLEAMLPRKASAATAPVRFAALYYPNGSPGLEWEPVGSGTGYTLSPLFDALSPFHDDINLCTNIN